MTHNSSKLKVLHTSDWHLGRSLYERKRYTEFSQFLGWLTEFVVARKIDILLIAGDIFDTTTPGNRAQELYYQFLTKVSQSGLRHIVITGGNHDSPSFLNAPKELLRFLNVYVIGSITESPQDEVIVLRDKSQAIEAIICAVPYLRDKDIRTVEAGEKLEDKNSKLMAGISAHYALTGELAVSERNGNDTIPIIGMGHLFAAGGKTTEGDGVRELYVGGAALVNEKSFPECFDYLALGHLHSAQKVGGSETKRYCGSPIPMSFGEAGPEKKVLVIEFDDRTPQITECPIPCFQELKRVTGDAPALLLKLQELKKSGSNAWLEIDYTGSEVFAGLSELVLDAISGTGMEVLRTRTRFSNGKSLTQIDDKETLDNLDPGDVFTRCLDAHQLKEPDRTLLRLAYNEIIMGMGESDRNAE